MTFHNYNLVRKQQLCSNSDVKMFKDYITQGQCSLFFIVYFSKYDQLDFKMLCLFYLCCHIYFLFFSWYFGPIEFDKANELLHDAMRGTFLIRESGIKP